MKDNIRTDNTIDFFVSPEGEQAKLVAARPEQTLSEALSASGIGGESLLAYHGDDPDDIDLDEPDEAAFGTVDLDATIASLDVRRHGHITCHRCRLMNVAVNYNGREVARNFRPAATVARVTEWAERRLGISDGDADGLVLEVCESDDRPRGEQRLGELVHGSRCAICFDLVPRERVNG